jgi:CheY-like chemotaxis protein
MARILVAASAEPRAIIERVLTGHELVCAQTLAQAEQCLREQRFDLIICTIAFDESRMFDFLRLAKSKPSWRRIPFIAARLRPHILRSPTALRDAAFTCGALGAEAFLDVADYQMDPEPELRAAIDGFLTARRRGG